jgi:hypothetical protein
MAIFDCANWRPVGNHGGRMSAQRGLLLHHACGDGSLHGWFNNPASGVSAHFWVARDGIIEQYVDSEVVAWHAMNLNDTYCGVETEGCVAPPHAEPMTEAMVLALAVLYAEGHARHGWPNALANYDGEAGFGFHRMGVATDCPCDVRLARRAEILALAFQGPQPQPPPTGEVDDMSEFVGYTAANQYHITVGNGHSKAIRLGAAQTGTSLTSPPIELPYVEVDEEYVRNLNEA